MSGTNAEAAPFVPSWLKPSDQSGASGGGGDGAKAPPAAAPSADASGPGLNSGAKEWRPGLGQSAPQQQPPQPFVPQQPPQQPPGFGYGMPPQQFGAPPMQQQQQHHQQFHQPPRPPQQQHADPAAAAGGAPPPPPGGDAAPKHPPMFYDHSGRMIRPEDQPHFFNPRAAPPLPSIQVGRTGTVPSAHQRAGITPQPADSPARQHHPSHQQSGVTTMTADPTAPGVLPSSTEEANIFQTLAKLNRPVLVLVLGGRGSGKSTQSRAVAIKYGLLHLCSGDLVRAGESPLGVLEDVLRYVTEGDKQQASDDAAADDEPHKFAAARRGIVLDRFVTNAEADPWYLLELVHRYNLQLDLIVNLMMSYDASVARAEERDKTEAEEAEKAGDAAAAEAARTRPKNDQRRMLEHLTVFNCCTQVFEPYGGLVCLDVEGKSIEEVEHQVHLRVDRTIVGIRAGAAGTKRKMLPAPELCPGVTMNLRYDDFAAVRTELHTPLQTPASKVQLSPASLMTGVVHSETVKKLRWYLKDYHVTWKADGVRIIVARHLTHGLIAFTAKFSSFYVVDPKLVPSHWADLPSGWKADSDDADEGVCPVTHIFDAELVENNHGKWRLYLFDCLYAVSVPPEGKPLVGTKTLWGARYQYLGNLCTGLSDKSVWNFVSLKPFVPCADIRSLVASPPSFPTDGLVLQHADPYRIPTDSRVFKWKPQSMCTADFRLSKGLEEATKNRWLFFPMSLRPPASGKGAPEEVGFKNAIVEIPTKTVETANLSDGAVVECLKTDKTLVSEGFEYEVWEFLRPRPDKVFPNYEAIAKQIDEMQHLTQAEFVALCEEYCNSGSNSGGGGHSAAGRGGPAAAAGRGGAAAGSSTERAPRHPRATDAAKRDDEAPPSSGGAKAEAWKPRAPRSAEAGAGGDQPKPAAWGAGRGGAAILRGGDRPEQPPRGGGGSGGGGRGGASSRGGGSSSSSRGGASSSRGGAGRGSGGGARGSGGGGSKR